MGVPDWVFDPAPHEETPEAYLAGVTERTKQWRFMLEVRELALQWQRDAEGEDLG